MSDIFNNKKKLFIWVYILGVVFSFAILLSALLHEKNVGISLRDYSYLIFPFCIGHMFLLIGIGYLCPNKARAVVGDRVQTAGYLYTLIGFSSALLHVNGQEFNLSEVMTPLGSALLTSILGWFAGGELVLSKGSTQNKNLNDEIDKLATEIDGFLKAVQNAHTIYVTTLHKASDDFDKLREKQTQIISGSTALLSESKITLRKQNEASNDLLGSLTKVSEVLSKNIGGDFVDCTEKILINAKAHASALNSAAKEAENSSQYLSQSRVLIAELEKLIRHISTPVNSAD